MILRIMIPVHDCSMHKVAVGSGASPSYAFVFYQCTMCKRTWEEKSRVVKSIEFEL